MIGGIDIEIPTRCGESSVEVSVRAIRQRWPRAEFENGISGDRYHHFWQIPFGEIAEIFVYRESTRRTGGTKKVRFRSFTTR